MGSVRQGQGQGQGQRPSSGSLGISCLTSLTLRTTVTYQVPSHTMKQVKPAGMWGKPKWNGSNTHLWTHCPTEEGARMEIA